MDNLLIAQLKAKHDEIGETIAAAEKTNAFLAIGYAKKAAADSHELIGEMLNCLIVLSKAQ